MKSKKIVTFLLVISLLIIFAQNTSAKVESTINLKKIKGYTEYKIGGSDYGFVSLLEFPINHNFIGGKISYERDYRYEFSLYTNLTEKAGKMKDSDWIYDFGIEGNYYYVDSNFQYIIKIRFGELFLIIIHYFIHIYGLLFIHLQL